MLDNMNFYAFMHKQILILIGLFAGTGLSYVFIGSLYSSYLPETSWYLLILLVSFWGYKLYKSYSHNNYSIEEKEKWLTRTRYFLFTYFSIWTIIFFVYVSRNTYNYLQKSKFQAYHDYLTKLGCQSMLKL